MTIDQAADLFLLFISGRGRSKTTVNFYRRYLVEWQRGICVANLADVTPELLDEWAAGLRGERLMFPNHRRPNTPNQTRPYSPHTVAGLIGVVKTFIGFCAARGYVQSNVAAHLRKPGLSHQARNRAMRVQDLYRMLDVAGVRDRAMLLFMADTGARRGEVVGLRVGALDLDGLCGEVVGKTGRRPVEFTATTANWLRLWLTERAAIGAEGDRVFVGTFETAWQSYGQPLGNSGINAIFQRLAKRAGVTGPASPHALRHLVGQHLAGRVNLELVRLKLGHQSITTTAMYYANQDRSHVAAATQMHSLLNDYQ